MSKTELGRKKNRSFARNTVLNETREKFPTNSRVIWSGEAGKPADEGPFLVRGSYMNEDIPHITIAFGDREISRPATWFVVAS